MRSILKDITSGAVAERSGNNVDGLTVKQYLAPQGLFAATEQANGSLTFEMFKASDVQAAVVPGELHSVAATAVASTSLTFSRFEEPVTHDNFIQIAGMVNGKQYYRVVGATLNPDGSGGNVVELKNGMKIETIHTYITTADLSNPDFWRPDLAALAARDADGHIHVETVTTSKIDHEHAAWVPVSSKTKVFQTLLVTRKEVMLEEAIFINGPAGAEELKTSYTFEDDFLPGTGEGSPVAVNRSYGQLLSRESPDGSWVFYDHDLATGMPWRIYRPWLGQPATLSAAKAMTPTERMAVCQVDEYLYSLGDPLENVQKTTTIQGAVVATLVKSMTENTLQRIQTTTTTRRRLAPDGVNLESYSTTQIKTSALSGTGRATLVSVKNDDGTLTLLDTKPGNFDAATGIFTESPDGHFRASTTISLALAAGQAVAGKTLKQTNITNEVGQTVLETTAIATGNGAAAGASYDVYDGRKYVYDDQSRLIATTMLDGTVVEEVTPGPNWKTVKDSSGVITQIYFDDFGQETQRSVNDLADGNDSVAGGSGSSSTTAGADGGVEEYQYANGVWRVTGKDVAGRMIWQRDPNTQVITRYAYSKGITPEGDAFNRVTQTLPNGAIKITDRYLDGRLRSITGTGVVEEHHIYAVHPNGTLMETVRTGSANSPRFVLTISDGAGGVLKEVKPSADIMVETLETCYFRDELGRVVRVTRPALGDQITEYDAFGNVTARGVDMNANHLLDRTGTDVLTETGMSIAVVGGHGQETTTTRTFTTDGSATVLTRTVARRLGCASSCASEITTTEPDGTVRTEIKTVNRTTGLNTVTRKETRPGSGEKTVSVQRYLRGLLVRETLAGVSGDIVHRYEVSGRRIKTVDPRSGIQRWNYGSPDVLQSSSTGPDGDEKVTTYSYYPQTSLSGDPDPMAGQLQTTTHPDGNTTSRQYDLMGRVTFEGGTATYPVKYEYDSFGQRTVMRTRRSAAAQVADADWDATTWACLPGTGKLESKTDAAGKAVRYTYDQAGQLHTRIWARKEEDGTSDLVTTYTYDAAGRLTGTSYSDDTPAVAITLDRTGRALTTTDASGTRTSTYDGPGGALSGVSYGEDGASILLANLSVAYGFDDDRRRSSISVKQGEATLSTTGYTYDPNTSRMATITHGGQTATYGWTAQVAGLPGTVTYSGAGLTGTRVPDAHGRLDSITWQLNGAGSPLVKNDYTLDDRGRRTASIREDGVNWSYGYNDRGEVTSGLRGFQHFDYQFDEIGNRTQASEGYSTWLNQTVNYTANNLNQYPAITNPHPGRKLIQGQIAKAASFIVTGTTDGVYHTAFWGENSWGNVPGTRRFNAEVHATTENAPAFLKVTIEGRKVNGGAQGQTIVSKKESGFYFPPKDESLAYDDDGNLILDGRWRYEWDAENRLKAMETTATAAAAGVPRQRLEFVYDSQSRSVRKVVKDWAVALQTFVVTTDTRFLYDGWNVIAEFDASPGLPTSSSPRLSTTYAWGLDLSGTETGAGGVGGLLFVSLYSSSSPSALSLSATLAPAYDGNGNVLAYAACSTGQIVARYEYDPFGKLLVKDEDASVAGRLHHQFSTKYCDAETGLSYYGKRYYSTDLSRWTSPDPISVKGGFNLYGIVVNDPVNRWDILGMLGTSMSGPSGVAAALALAEARALQRGASIAATCACEQIRSQVSSDEFIKAWEELFNSDPDPDWDIDYDPANTPDPHMVDTHMLNNDFTKALEDCEAQWVELAKGVAMCLEVEQSKLKFLEKCMEAKGFMYVW